MVPKLTDIPKGKKQEKKTMPSRETIILANKIIKDLNYYYLRGAASSLNENLGDKTPTQLVISALYERIRL